MNSLVNSFYDFLKEKYGKQETEVINPEYGILRTIQVDIPGLDKNNSRQYWTIHVEQNPNPEEAKCSKLVLGTHWESRNNSWSRYLTIKEEQHSSQPFFNLIKTIAFKKDHDLLSLVAFLKVWEEFFEQSYAIAEN